MSPPPVFMLRHGATPLAIATERDYEAIAAIIQKEERQRETGRAAAVELPAELGRAFEAGDEDLVIDILNHHPDLRDLRLSGERWSLLHMASAVLFRRAATWLLDQRRQRRRAGRRRFHTARLGWATFRSQRERAGTRSDGRLLRSRGAALTRERP